MYFSHFRIPDSFKDIWTRTKKLQWKNVKTTYICSLHFESKYFNGRKLDLTRAEPLSNELDSANSSASLLNGNDRETSRELQNKLDELVVKNTALDQRNLELVQENNRLKQQNYYLKRKSDKLTNDVADLKVKVDELSSKFQLSQMSVLKLTQCASEVPQHLFKATMKRVCGEQDREYHPALKKFALSLHLCSSKAYR